MNLANERTEKLRSKMEQRRRRRAYYQRYHNPRLAKIVTGIFFVIAGTIFLARETGIQIPEYIFKWHTLMIAIGIIFGAKHSFRNFFWLVPVTVGCVFLIDAMTPGMHISKFAWPIILIAVGILFILRPKGWRNFEQFDNRHKDESGNESNEDLINIDAVFSGIERTIISKNLKGGTINCMMGGADLDLSQSDIEGTIILDVYVLMGGIALVIPPHWFVVSEVSAIFGGIEDRRHTRSESEVDKSKTLIIRGSVIMGGMEIKSY